MYRGNWDIWRRIVVANIYLMISGWEGVQFYISLQYRGSIDVSFLSYL